MAMENANQPLRQILERAGPQADERFECSE
jgi:hypothetical protein